MSKQFPAMHVKFSKIICINLRCRAAKQTADVIIASKNLNEMPLKGFCHKKSSGNMKCTGPSLQSVVDIVLPCAASGVDKIQPTF